MTGIDFSQSSIDYARKVAAENHLTIRYVNQNYLDFKTEDRFDLILMIMCDFCALSPAQRQQMLAKFYTHLVPNGAFLLDVHSLNDFEQREEIGSYSLNLLNKFWSPNQYFEFLNTFNYEKEKVSLNKYTIIEADRTRTIYNWLQYFTPQSLQKELEQAGFTMESCYADVAGLPFDDTARVFAVVGRKV